MASGEQEDPLLKETQTQYVIFPIEYDDMWKMYKSFVENIWTVQEHLSPLAFNDKETHFFKIFAAFFATSNSFGLVNENFVEEFAKTVQIAEAKFFYGHQLFIQNIHFEMYNKFFENLAKTEDER
jgi:ribonucleoside-diphosphate reductase subunit M2